MRAVKVTLTLPHELHAELYKEGRDFNWSAVAAKALREELTRRRMERLAGEGVVIAITEGDGVEGC